MTFLAKYPPGLAALFMVEMWERFSYYGMRAILVLYLVDAVQTGGLGLAAAEAAAIYGLYTASVYILACRAAGSPTASGAPAARSWSAASSSWSGTSCSPSPAARRRSSTSGSPRSPSAPGS